MVHLDVSAEEIFNLLKSEKKTGEIMPLRSTFYREAEAFIKQQPPDQTQNIAKTVNIIKEKRMQKILIYLAYDKPLPQPLPQEEEETKNEIKLILSKTATQPKTKKIKITAHIPEVITSSGNKLGPYEQNEIIELYNNTDIKFIIDNKIGEAIN